MLLEKCAKCQAQKVGKNRQFRGKLRGIVRWTFPPMALDMVRIAKYDLRSENL